MSNRLRTLNISLFAHKFEWTKHKISIVSKVYINRTNAFEKIKYIKDKNIFYNLKIGGDIKKRISQSYSASKRKARNIKRRVILMCR